MRKSRNKLIDEIYSGALDRAGPERDEFLREECGADAELRQEVAALLKAAEAPDDRLDTQISGIRDRLMRSVFDDGPDAREDLSGQSINHWRIETRIARGGLATVYLAHRDDGEFDQTAAFKVLRRGLDTDDLIARFRTERQILSTLKHQAIAQILDGGALDDGRPYLVLEFVNGLPITAYSNEKHLSIRDRVILTIKVLKALHHAHRHLIVHRDIKPSNILVSGGGNVTLLDFGIAKLLDPASMPGTSTLTRTGVSLLTPGYGSPEQHAGEPITTASDIYQVGLVLYELLTGQRLFDSQPDRADIESLVPSRALHGKPGYKRVRGDLDAIVRKATHGDAAQRYASADEMISDLQRYLDGRPVIAQPDSVGYRIGKLAKRHPWLIPASILVTLAIAAYITTITLYSQRLAREEQLAAAAQQFMVDLIGSPDPYAPADPKRGRAITVVEALEIGQSRIRAELNDQPELKATLLVSISDVYGSLDQGDESTALREEALAIERELYGNSSRQVMESLQHLGRRYGTDEGDLELADRRISEQLEIARALSGESSPEFGAAEAIAGMHALSKGDNDTGIALLQSAISKMRKAPEVYAQTLIDALLRSVELNGLESSAVSTAAIAEAEGIADSYFGTDSLQAALVRVRFAASSTSIADYEGAERNFLAAIPVLESHLGRDHHNTMTTLSNLGYLYVRSGELEKAEPIHRALLNRQIDKHGPAHRSAADSYQNLAGTLTKLHRYDESIPMHRQAYEIYKTVLNNDNYMIAFPLLSIAYAELQRGNAELAGDAATEALQRFEATVPGTFLEGVARCLKGLSLEKKGQNGAGAAMVLNSHELMENASIPDPYPALCRLPGS